MNTLLSVLKNNQIRDDYLCLIATDFIYEIYRVNILTINRNVLLNSLLNFIFQRKNSWRILEKLKYYIEDKFFYLPLAKYEIFQIIKSRYNIQTLM